MAVLRKAGAGVASDRIHGRAALVRTRDRRVAAASRGSYWFMLLVGLVLCLYLTPSVRAEDVNEEAAFTLDFDDDSGGPGGGATQSGSFLDQWADNLRLNIDIVSRVETTRRRGQAAGLSAIGLDVHKVFSDADGDIGTALLQVYLARRDNALPVPMHVEDDDDWEGEFHDFYFNFRRFGRGRTNFKVGHFDVPFGLEPQTDTHFTLHQVIAGPNLGMKKDWGVSLNGQMPAFDYEVSLTRGSGAELDRFRDNETTTMRSADRNWAVAGRIGTPGERDLSVGVSGFYGNVLMPAMDITIRRVRVGVDVTRVINQLTFKAEASHGENFDDQVFNALVELNWAAPDDRFTGYVQGIYLGRESAALDWDEDLIVRVGGEWTVTERLLFSAQYSYDLEAFGSKATDSKVTVQMEVHL